MSLMSMVSDFWKNHGLKIGYSFTALVLLLIIYGNVLKKSQTPTKFIWEEKPELHICDSVDSSIRPGVPEFEKAIKFWSDRGWKFSKIIVRHCSQICLELKSDSMELPISCNLGAVTIDSVSSTSNPRSVAECHSPKNIGRLTNMDWTTIWLPDKIDERDISLILAHEMGHCLVGLGHNSGPWIGMGQLNPKSGHIMNPEISKIGWNDEGIPSPPVEWESIH